MVSVLEPLLHLFGGVLCKHRSLACLQSNYSILLSSNLLAISLSFSPFERSADDPNFLVAYGCYGAVEKIHEYGNPEGPGGVASVLPDSETSYDLTSCTSRRTKMLGLAGELQTHS